MPRTNGTQVVSITVKALNDGKAIIDGQGCARRLTCARLVGYRGIVARNGTDNVFLRGRQPTTCCGG